MFFATKFRSLQIEQENEGKTLQLSFGFRKKYLKSWKIDKC